MSTPRPEDGVVDYARTTAPEISSQRVVDLLAQMKPAERARYERQIQRTNEQLVEIGQRHLQLQALPIGNPDPVPKRHCVKKKALGKADALTAAKLADRAFIIKERA